jgi:hypothetical protein
LLVDLSTVSTNRLNAVREFEVRRRDFIRQIYGLLAMGFGYLYIGNVTRDIAQSFCNRVILLLHEVEKAKLTLDGWKASGMTISLRSCLVKYDQLITGRVSELIKLRRDLCQEAIQYQTKMVEMEKQVESLCGTTISTSRSVPVKSVDDENRQERIQQIIASLKD